MEKRAVKADGMTEDRAKKPAKCSQKDVDAPWTNKHGRSRYCYKDDVSMGRRHKLVRRDHVSDAELQDSPAVGHLLMQGNTSVGVWADHAYRSEEIEATLRAHDQKSHMHRQGRRCKPPTEQVKTSKRRKSSVRARGEHVFGAQANDMGGTLLRTIGLARATAKIGVSYLAYKLRRLVKLCRLSPRPA